MIVVLAISHVRLIAKWLRIDCLSVPQLPASTVLQKHREFQYEIFIYEKCSYDAALNTIFSKNTVTEGRSKKLIFDTVEISRYVLPLFLVTVFLPDMAIGAQGARGARAGNCEFVVGPEAEELSEVIRRIGIDY